MDLKFYIDPETDRPHVENHGITEAEVREVLDGRGLVLRGSGNSRHALGRTAAGRYLKVVYAPSKDIDGAFVITAYELRGKELKAYRRRRRRKKR
jgi:uncharacterized DUF497 family protein